MEDWLRDRRNALVDGAIVYAVSRWVVPEVVSMVIYLACSPFGAFALFTVAYSLLLAGSVYLASKLEQPALDRGSDEDYEYVYVLSYKPPPSCYMLGSRGTWVRVRRRQEA